MCAQDTVWDALHNVSFRQSACHWRSSENTHTHEHAREAGPQGVRAAWPTPPVRSGPRVRDRVPACRRHTRTPTPAPLRRACHGLKIDANPSTGLPSQTEAAAESWPWGCLRLRSASGTETRAASRGSGAAAGGLGAGDLGWGAPGGGRGRLKGAWEPAGGALPGPPPSAPGCLGWRGLGDSHEPVTTTAEGWGGGREGAADPGPRSWRMGLERVQGRNGEKASATELRLHLGGFPLSFHHSASHRQQHSVPRKGCLGAEW